jgi:hypothetical protein
MTPKKYLCRIFCLLFTFACTYSQSLYMPIEFQNAYENETRSHNGKPGTDYWQNKSVYDIDVIIIPSTRIVKGS